ncbi:hypothetical protein PIROE2DRAFT_15578 [Piromyces sp. E2]|nr:hypothetical protein PIROE2DRAFT_15578 [Piromyces sp. E2]|eukprot:OUM59010.1 hypothetical protein PIROE2DRAFT_15578 [Piromyces sp. E2]
MNFKTLTSLFVLVLASIVKTSPILQCNDKKALLLTWDPIYACLLPVNKFESTENEHCVILKRINKKEKGKAYCVSQTSIPACTKEHKNYNLNFCNHYLDAMADPKGYDVNVYKVN